MIEVAMLALLVLAATLSSPSPSHSGGAGAGPGVAWRQAEAASPLQSQSHQQQHLSDASAGKLAGGPAAGPEPVIPPQLSSREVEKAIVDRILGDGYDKRIRPAGSAIFNTTKPGEFH